MLTTTTFIGAVAVAAICLLKGSNLSSDLRFVPVRIRTQRQTAISASRSRQLPTSERGAALLAALCFTLVLAIALSSYITMCYRSLQLTATGTTTLSDGTTQSRTLTSTASQAPLFVNAIAATGNSTTTYHGRVRFQSAGTVDSCNSTTDLNAATPGYAAIVASASDLTSLQTSTGTVKMTNVKIKGSIATRPGSAGVSYSTSATLDGPSSPANPKIDPTRETTSPYQPVFDVLTPAATLPLTGGSQTIGTPGATTPSYYYYYAGDYYFGGTNTLAVDGPVVLVISGYLATQDTAKIAVTANGSLTVFVGGALWLDGGGIVNATKLPKNVAIFGQTGNSSVFEFSPPTPFYGVIYAPQRLAELLQQRQPLRLYGALVG